MEQGRSAVVGTAVLRDYPLRLWAAQQEHTAELLREFHLMIYGRQSSETQHDAPQQLVDLAEFFTSSFGLLLDDISATRQAALDAGQDRMDSEVPLVDGTPELLGRVRDVLATVDDFCRSGDMLALARPPLVVRLSEWSTRQLVAQYEGKDSTPWPGPF